MYKDGHVNIKGQTKIKGLNYFLITLVKVQNFQNPEL